MSLGLSEGLALHEVRRCPFCNSCKRELEHDDLVDGSFQAVGGTWSLWRCAGCRAAYLDPRLSDADLVHAYRGYYTHNDVPESVAQSGRARVRTAVLELIGDALHRHGSRLRRMLGKAALGISPSSLRAAEARFRHLPRRPRDGGRLLDVGCGNGGFLMLMRRHGWTVAGCDFDEDALRAARRAGLNVRLGDAHAFEHDPDGFDAVTMSHVIEHVADPLDQLHTVHTLLRPGGSLFLETPNIDAQGHAVFGGHWRGLETPRHLILFSEAALRRALSAAGFIDLVLRPRPEVRRQIWLKSARIAQGLSPYGGADALDPETRRMLDIAADPSSDRAEFLTVTARRP